MGNVNDNFFVCSEAHCNFGESGSHVWVEALDIRGLLQALAFVYIFGEVATLQKCGSQSTSQLRAVQR